MERMSMTEYLYKDEDFKDNCGFGLIAQQQGKPTHQLVLYALQALKRMTHRGGISSDGKTGDGCGILVTIADHFFRENTPFKLPENYAIGMVFLSRDKTKYNRTKQIFSSELKHRKINIIGWRKVPVNDQCLGKLAREKQPVIEQVFVSPAKASSIQSFENALFLARRHTEQKITNDATFHICSLSTKLISYKGLMMPEDIAHYYRDLKNPGFKSFICVFHQRFSTNTLPHWSLAQPFRMLAHNGEMNTIKGNRQWAEARSPLLKSKICPEIKTLQPLICQTGSDSYSVDNMLEVLTQGGLDIFNALRLMIQPAWSNVSHMSPNLKAFYHYNRLHCEPWDGPAGLVITDGRYAICALDRNGLRPARWLLSGNQYLMVASEAGVFDSPELTITARSRIGAGEILALDTLTGKIYQKHDIDMMLQKQYTYQQWVRTHVTYVTYDRYKEQQLLSQNLCHTASGKTANIAVWKKLFLLSKEDISRIIYPLTKNAQEPVSSMGDDTPIAVMSEQIRSPYDYFRQQFAQVTNPPIDSLRETVVMSVEVALGPLRNVFAKKEEEFTNIKLSSPVLSCTEFRSLFTLPEDKRLTAKTFSLHYSPDQSMKKAISLLCDAVEKAVEKGNTLIHLTDNYISTEKIPIPAVFAVSAVHQHLIKKQIRAFTNLIVETATTHNPHHFAVLLGFGANAIYPYLAYTLVINSIGADKKNTTEAKACHQYRKGIIKGLLKMMSKMGISTMVSYQGAQLFQVVGLSREILTLCFSTQKNYIDGARFTDFHNEQLYLSERAWMPTAPEIVGGIQKFMYKGEYHALNPDVVQSLQKAVNTGDPFAYKEYAELINKRKPAMIRDLLALNIAKTPIPVSQTESKRDIIRRFDSAAMSLGALSPEAHESIAEAMNRLGGRSNSGEGGEDPKRFGTIKNSKIKQIASGRFGVTPHYLVNAEVLQIKIAQGAKPGEGGQLPGEKVNDLIAQLRYSSPGVTLISPPPHHDIYSIEDLAQLIFDLKSVNPIAKVAVKLVSGPGVGTVAAGVAKAYADIITISGHDGGTGASPVSSTLYAGSPWEIGLAEAQQALVANNLRDKIILQTDGGLKTGLDVIKAALLGADSFAFGTTPMIALGCKFLRCCHLNNCATGIATQNLYLRNHHYSGTVEKAMNFFTFIAEEVRNLLSLLGASTIQDIIGRTDLLRQIEGNTNKQRQLNLTPIFGDKNLLNTHPHAYGYKNNPPFDKAELAMRIQKDCEHLIEEKISGKFQYIITNQDRSIGANLSGKIAQLHGNQGMKDTPIRLDFTGSAGQSFGVWNAGGLHLFLYGEANDYVGKGMAGGKIVITPPSSLNSAEKPSAICGNTCLYGATGGECFIAGSAGERFAVRNSGCNAVIEGVGDHCCEYMTRGCVTVLGQTGHNFGAGMTGGIAYILDTERNFVDRYHHNSIDITRISIEEMEEPRQLLYNIILAHIRETESAWAQEILDGFNDYIEFFWLATPKASQIQSLLNQIHGRPE